MSSSRGIREMMPSMILPVLDIGRALEQGKEKNHKNAYLQHQNIKYVR